MMPEPVIAVGILKAPAIRLRLTGRFVLTLSGKGVTGDIEVRTGHRGVELRTGGRSIAAGESIRLSPGVPWQGEFTVMGVVIGIGLHWESKENQVFRGNMRFMKESGEVRLVNELPAEQYLRSVITSEMNASSPLELLKAHAIISRSWLISQVEAPQRKLPSRGAGEPALDDMEILRWYDREDHEGFHVCADDHCQRYQGFARTGDARVDRAVDETAGQVLTHSGRLCDTRYSKCCGGMTERYESCWEPVAHPCLESVPDREQASGNVPDLRQEPLAGGFIRGRPEAFCNTEDTDLVKQVLNDYDHPGSGHFRWEVRYTRQELSELIAEKSGLEFGEILELEPVERGPSGRLVRLRIIGSRRTMVVGKELEIRRWLSPSHLYSSAFIVERDTGAGGVPDGFKLRGAGWGHGVGLCQIGAAVMASGGYGHRQILQHYYRGATINQWYGK